MSTETQEFDLFDEDGAAFGGTVRRTEPIRIRCVGRIDLRQRRSY
jgi:hypothetical protein